MDGAFKIDPRAQSCIHESCGSPPHRSRDDAITIRRRLSVIGRALCEGGLHAPGAVWLAGVRGGEQPQTGFDARIEGLPTMRRGSPRKRRDLAHDDDTAINPEEQRTHNTMPLFGSRREPSPEVVPVHDTAAAPRKHNSLFHRHEPAPAPAPVPATTHHKTGTGGGLFHRNRTPSPPATTTTHGSSSLLHHSRTSHSISSRSSADSSHHRHSSGSKPGLLSRAMGRHGDDDVDPSILQARERVMDAEQAEVQADRALEEARLRVREAREHARRVEAEAEEDARRARVKQRHAKEVTKRGKGLGRHGI
ncbi:hypothetical protein PCL_04512 [Purpureocillium lilacinum]|uniref:Uncharacterized protein n=1 Tax=Purpureocillium lilacinum TaxID=33203 RepID=A0A2U3DXP3_PURLI|nr:hypothetical protein PCL_04512 [Purpureocillium lilacinum]